MNLFTEQQKEIIHAVNETASRYFMLEDFIINNFPIQAENNDLYTLEEVAEIVSMSIVTIRQYVRNGKLKAFKQWKNWMVPSNEVARLLYERKNGKKLSPDKVMLVVLDGDLYEEDSYIDQYQIVTVTDILENIQLKSTFDIDQYIKKIIPKPHGSCQYIEAVSCVENFFRRTGDVIYSDLTKIESPLLTFLPEEYEKCKFFIEHAQNLIEETPYEALETIKKNFGDPNNAQTTLKIYKLLLDLSNMYSNK